jgi:exodeoxyribonuclease V gamma subunit
VQLDHLETWGVGERLLEAQLRGVGMDAAIAAEVARGTLPPGRLSAQVLRTVRPTVEAIATQALAYAGDGAAPASLDVRVELDDGRRLSGTAPGVSGDVLRTVSYSRVNPRHRLAAWVRVLALTAAYPERAFEAVTVGRARRGADEDARTTTVRVPPLGPDADTRLEAARGHLATLLDLHRRGMREPLPLACMASAAYARAATKGGDPEKAARNEWESAWNFDREDKELEHQLVLDGVLTFDELAADPPRADEEGDGWVAAEPTRFGRYARRLWDGLLAVEEVHDR